MGNARCRPTAARGAVRTIFMAFAVSIVSLPVAADTDLTDMSLEELMNVEVTSVSKRSQAKTRAAAAITVITNEDIRRGGFTTVPEVLRIVPGVQVAQINANVWAISARGNNQEFANKLLVLIDGRSVYTPLFGGVYWDIQDYPLEDIERIEVIRGPGGTVWGANAVNGVINVITKHSRDTQGTLVSAYGGSQEVGATGRHGGTVGESTQYRVFARGFKVEDYDIDSRQDADDDWWQVRGGFRIDSAPTEDDEVRVSADYYDADYSRAPASVPPPGFDSDDNEARGGNVLVSWDHTFSEQSKGRAKAYYDRTYRDATQIEEDRHTVDMELQHDTALSEAVSLIWGANYRFSTTHIKPSGSLAPTPPFPPGTPVTRLVPRDRDYHLGGGFGQIQWDVLDDSLSLIAGIKLGGNNWSGFEYQPSARFIYTPVEGHAVWGAISRAVRTPTQVDRDIQTLFTGGFLTGHRAQRSETVLSFEAGYRFFQLERVNAEISAFYSLYEDLSSIGATPNPLVQTFDNNGESDQRGVEIEVNFMPVDWWRMSFGYAVLDIDWGGTQPTLKNVDPEHQVVFRSFWDLPMGFEFDTSIYWIDGLSDSVPAGTGENVESYVRLDLRLGYRPTDWLELSLVGQNLTDRRHYEYDDIQLGQSSQVPRSGYGKVTFRF